MKNVMRFLVVIFLATLVRPVVGETLKGRSDLGIDGGSFVPEGDGEHEPAFVYGARVRHFFTDAWGLDGSLLFGQSDLRNSDNKAKIMLPTLNAVYYLKKTAVQPYLSGGVGFLQYNSDEQGPKNQLDFAIPLGIGLDWVFSKEFGLRFEAKDVINTQSGSETHNGLFTVGLFWMYAETEEEPLMVVAVKPPLDSDRDGVSDDRDLCPETAPQTKVDDKGCTLDSDGDGVADDSDECPQTPKGLAVNEQGCPKEDATALPKAQWVLRDIHFTPGAAKLQKKSEAALENTASILLANPTVKVEIEGFTDSTGTPAGNKRLSELRALAVKAYLVEKGVGEDRLFTKGFGDTQPIADNATPEGRAKNRRIEFKILEK